MSLSREKQKQWMQEHRKGVIPSVIPKPDLATGDGVIPKHCHLSFCVICDSERYQEWFKRSFGRYDEANRRSDAI